MQYLVPRTEPTPFDESAVTPVDVDALFGVPSRGADGAPRPRGRPRGSHYARSDNAQLKQNTLHFLSIAHTCHLSDATADKLLGFIGSICADIVPSLAAARSMASELIYVPPVSKMQIRRDGGRSDAVESLAYTDPLAHLAALVADGQVTAASQPTDEELAAGARTLRALQGVDGSGRQREKIDAELLRSLPLPRDVHSSAATAFMHERFASFKRKGALVVGVEVHFDDATATRGTKCTFLRVRFVGARAPRQWLEVAAFAPGVLSVNAAFRVVVLPLLERLHKGIQFQFVGDDGATSVLVCGDVQAIIADKVAIWEAMNMTRYQPMQSMVKRGTEDWWRSMCDADGVGAVTDFQKAIKWRSLSAHAQLLLDVNAAIVTGSPAASEATKRYKGVGLSVVRGCAVNDDDRAAADRRARDPSAPFAERQVMAAFAGRDSRLFEVPFILHPALRTAASVGSLIAPPDPMHSLDEGELRRIVELCLATVERPHINLLNQLLCRIPSRPIGSRLENHARTAFHVGGSDDTFESHKVSSMTCKQFIGVVHALPPVLVDAGYTELGRVVSRYLDFYDVAMRGGASGATWGDLRDARKQASDEFVKAVNVYRLPVKVGDVHAMTLDEVKAAVWQYLCYATKTVDLNHATFAMWHGNAGDIDTESAEAALKSAMFVVKHQSALRPQLATVSIQKQANWRSATAGMLGDALARRRGRAAVDDAAAAAVCLVDMSVAAVEWELALLRELMPGVDVSKTKLVSQVRVEARGVGRHLKFHTRFSMVLLDLDDGSSYCGSLVMAGTNCDEAFLVLCEYELVATEHRNVREVAAADCGCLAMVANGSAARVPLASIVRLRGLVVTAHNENTLTLPIQIDANRQLITPKVFWHKHLSHY